MYVHVESTGQATCNSGLCSNPSFQGLQPTLAALGGGGYDFSGIHARVSISILS